MSDKKKKGEKGRFVMKSRTGVPVGKSNSCTADIRLKQWRGIPLDPKNNPIANPKKFTK